jgi:hypothetical protein
MAAIVAHKPAAVHPTVEIKPGVAEIGGEAKLGNAAAGVVFS